MFQDRVPEHIVEQMTDTLVPQIMEDTRAQRIAERFVRSWTRPFSSFRRRQWTLSSSFHKSAFQSALLCCSRGADCGYPIATDHEGNCGSFTDHTTDPRRGRAHSPDSGGDGGIFQLRPQERIPKRIVEQIVNVPVLQIRSQIVKVVKVIPQEISGVSGVSRPLRCQMLSCPSLFFHFLDFSGFPVFSLSRHCRAGRARFLEKSSSI